MSIVREYYDINIKLRGLDAANPDGVKTTTTCVFRFGDEKKLSLQNLATLFKAVAEDFPALAPTSVKIYDDHVEFDAKPKAGYKPLPSKTIGLQG